MVIIFIKKPIVEKRKLYLTDLSNKQVGVDW
jgi:hypothetical protein